MKAVILVSIALLTLVGCERSYVKMEKSLDKNKARSYNLVVFNGGDTIFVDNFDGVVNVSKEDNSIYYFKNNELIEISGDYILRSKELPKKQE